MPEGQQASSEAYQKGQKQGIPEGQKEGIPEGQKAGSKVYITEEARRRPEEGPKKASRPEARHTRRPTGQKRGIPKDQKARRSARPAGARRSARPAGARRSARPAGPEETHGQQGVRRKTFSPRNWLRTEKSKRSEVDRKIHKKAARTNGESTGVDTDANRTVHKGVS